LDEIDLRKVNFMRTLPIWLKPGEDLRDASQEAMRLSDCTGAFVLSGIGSLSGASIRFAGNGDATKVEGDLESLTLAGIRKFH
jgi:predicted DNA-binding protein with PD1-like motif